MLAANTSAKRWPNFVKLRRTRTIVDQVWANWVHFVPMMTKLGQSRGIVCRVMLDIFRFARCRWHRCRCKSEPGEADSGHALGPFPAFGSIFPTQSMGIPTRAAKRLQHTQIRSGSAQLVTRAASRDQIGARQPAAMWLVLRWADCVEHPNVSDLVIRPRATPWRGASEAANKCPNRAKDSQTKSPRRAGLRTDGHCEHP